MVNFIRLNDILLGTSDDGGYREKERPQEESLTLMRDGALESTGKFGKSQDHSSCDTGKEDEIDDIEDSTNGDQAREGVRLDRDQCCDTARGHSQSIPGPSEMPKAFTERHVWLVWILPVRQLRVVVPAASMAVIIMSLFLKVDRRWRCRHRGRRWRRIVEWILCCLSLGVNRVAVGIHRSCVVGIASRVRARRCLDPGVGPRGLLRLQRILAILLNIRGLLNVHRQIARIVLRALVGVSVVRLIHLRSLRCILGWLRCIRGWLRCVRGWLRCVLGWLRCVLGWLRSRDWSD